jgi:hypothetical protein
MVLGIPMHRDIGNALDVPLHWATGAKKMDPPAGAAPAGFLYERNPQAAAWRRKKGFNSAIKLSLIGL